MFIGVDIGGTFTDLVVSVEGRLFIHKLLSSPHNPAEAMLAGLAAVAAVPDARISHGSTVATNAILERKGARTALITTQGFRDVLAIGRQNRPVLYTLHPQLPPPLIPRHWCYEVPERLDFRGDILTPLDLIAIDQVIDELAVQKIQSVAVCLLYSFVNPIHEYAIRDRLLERGILSEGQVSLSCEVLPQFREYERASTVALDAYVRPVMNRYLHNLETELPKESRLLVMKSDGGVVSAESARRQAVHTALSGPAAGVIGAYHLAGLAGYDHIITLDMGGTSTDVALCAGSLSRRIDSEIDGLPLRIPLIDIETVGAGGGSIARVDAGGALRVGPESAGANPGPIIYGQGGQQVTVSDANAVLGRLDPHHFLGGRMKLHLEPAYAAIDHLATQINMSRQATAQGIIDIANVNIDRAVRRVSVARGYDPRDFTLMAFGGAAPLHACEIAERLEIPRVLIPRYPGVLCAFGLLVADVQRDYSRSILANAQTTELNPLLDEMMEQARHDLGTEGIPEDRMHFAGWVDMRYRGQSYELTVAYSSDIMAEFHTVHERTYGYAMRNREVEVVNLRLQAVGQVEKPVLEAEPLTDNDGSHALIGNRQYEREKLLPGARFDAPALIFQFDSTTYIPSHWTVFVDGYHNLILTNNGKGVH